MTQRVSEADLEVTDFISRAGPAPRLYGDALVAAARADPRIVCLCADLAGATETDVFRNSLRERFFHTGIAEANMIGMAAGMARGGDIPFVHTFCVFATRRCYDQIAMQVAYPKLPVKIVGFLPGLTTLLGVSHQAIDDIALMRALPNMTVIEPVGPAQMAAAVHAALAVDGPVYLRMKRADGPLGPDFVALPLTPGKGTVVQDGSDGAIIACGLMVDIAIQAASTLAAEGLRVAVVNMSSIKPLDQALVLDFARRTGVIVTAENHSVIGGLSSAVADTLLESGLPIGFAKVGIQDTFGEGGSTPFLFEKYGLTAPAIVAAFHQARFRRQSLAV
jgi:transketolase